MVEIISQEEKRRRLGKIQQLEAELKNAKQQVNQIGERYGFDSPEFQRAQRGLESTHFERPPAKPITSREELLGTARAVTEGASLGAADEIGSGIAATASKMAGADEPFGEIYDEMMDQYETEQGRFTEQNPGVALLGNLAGGAATGGLSLLKSAQLYRNAPALVRGAATGGLLATEGAAVGAMSAPRGERAAGAASGALLNPMLYGGARTGGALFRGIADTISNQRIATPLGRGESFTPINMAQAEGILPSAYRKVVAPAAGGRKVREQSAKVFERALAKEKSAQRALNITERQAQTKANLAKEKIRRRGTETEDLLQRRLALSQSEIADQAESGADALKAQFRARAVRESLPVDTPPEVIEEYAKHHPMDVNLFMDEDWQTRGFRMVRDKAFTVEPDLVTRTVREQLNNPAQREFSNAIVDEINNSFTRSGRPITRDPAIPFRSSPYGGSVPNPPEATGKVDIGGDELIQIRNDLRMQAANLSESGESAIEANALRKAAHTIDRQIEQQLDAPLKQKYREELSRWGTRQTHDKAVQRAARTKQGMYDPEDWVGAGIAYSPKRAARRNAPLQEQAYELQDQLAQSKTQVARNLNEAKSDIKQGLRKSRERARAQKEQIKPAETREIKQAKNRLQAAKQTAREMHQRMPPMDPAAWTQRFSAQVLGTPFAAPAGTHAGPFASGFGRVLSGAGVAQGLGTQAVQRTLAGQTDTQAFIRRLLRGYDKNLREPLHRAGYGVLRAGATNTEG